MKNKILLVAAVAVACGAPVVAMADANIYGQFRYSLNSADNDLGAGSTLSGEDNVSLFGLKASAGDDVKAFVHLQTGAAADANGGRAFNQRFYFGGLKGGFGTVAYGRMTNAYKMPGFKLDPFYNMSHVGAGGTLAAGGATYGLSPASNGFTDNALQYTSPAMAGLKINAGIYVDDGINDDHGSNVGVSYNVGNFNAGLQIASNATTAVTVPGVAADGDAMRFHGGYKGGKWSAGASIELVDESATITNTYTYLTGSINFTDKTKLA
ncbi:MAG: porin, partial [Gammaproteobacteria bacterium]|nr:porin [Gammaproteobacteria bacterium]